MVIPKDKLIHSLSEASELIRRAENELQRPSEDVVAISVCNYANESIRKHLQAYLLLNKQKVDFMQSIEETLKQCIELNKKFKKIDLVEINCKSTPVCNNDEYCLSNEKVRRCLDIAQDTKSMVREELSSKL